MISVVGGFGFEGHQVCVELGLQGEDVSEEGVGLSAAGSVYWEGGLGWGYCVVAGRSNIM